MNFKYGVKYQTNGNMHEEYFMTVSDKQISEANTKDQVLKLTVKADSEKQYTLTVKNCSEESIIIKTASPFSTEIENLVCKDGADEIQFYTDWDHIWHNVGMTNSEDGIWNLKRYNSIYNAGIVRKSDAKGVAVTFETPNNFGSSINFEDDRIFAFEGNGYLKQLRLLRSHLPL